MTLLGVLGVVTDPTAGGEDPAEPAGDEGASESAAQTDADQADAPDKGSVADATPPKASSSKAATDSPDAASGQCIQADWLHATFVICGCSKTT